MAAHSNVDTYFMTTVRYRHSAVTEKSYTKKIMHPLKIYQLSAQKNRSKDTLKLEMQREWTHPLYKCKVKETLCGNSSGVSMTADTRLDSPTIESRDHVTNLRKGLLPQLFVLVPPPLIVVAFNMLFDLTTLICVFRN